MSTSRLPTPERSLAKESETVTRPPSSTEFAAHPYNAEALGEQLRDGAPSVYLGGMLRSMLPLTPGSFTKYREQLLSSCGSPHDPIEEMLVDQIMLAYHAIGRLQMRASETKDAKATAALSNAAAKLLGEFRRATTALQQYRINAVQTLKVCGADAKEAPPKRNVATG